MERKQENQGEPFKPEHTPEPPQHKDPRERMDKNSVDQPNDSPVKEEDRPKQKNNDSSPGKEKEKPKLLGESETEITDETTI